MNHWTLVNQASGIQRSIHLSQAMSWILSPYQQEMPTPPMAFRAKDDGEIRTQPTTDVFQRPERLFGVLLFLSRLECNGSISAHGNLCLLGSSDSPAPAFQRLGFSMLVRLVLNSPPQVICHIGLPKCWDYSREAVCPASRTGHCAGCNGAAPTTLHVGDYSQGLSFRLPFGMSSLDLLEPDTEDASFGECVAHTCQQLPASKYSGPRGLLPSIAKSQSFGLKPQIQKEDGVEQRRGLITAGACSTGGGKGTTDPRGDCPPWPCKLLSSSPTCVSSASCPPAKGLSESSGAPDLPRAATRNRKMRWMHLQVTGNKVWGEAEAELGLHCTVLGSSDPPTSASRIAGTTGMHHRTGLIFVYIFLEEIGSHYVGQAGLELLGSSGPPTSASQSAEITGTLHNPDLPSLGEAVTYRKSLRDLLIVFQRQAREPCKLQ
ncbi:hypothetical protein AAY473_033560 [Plecturocebus cupreus]